MFITLEECIVYALCGARWTRHRLSEPTQKFIFRSLPEGDGTVWKSPFKTLVWMGNYEKGFLWFCESEKNWSPLERNQRPNALTISRMGNEVILEVSPVTQSTIISSPTTYTFGFFATPVRPETKGWRSWTHNYADKAMDAEKRFGVVTKVIFASVYLTGGGEKNVAFYPRIWDRSRYETAKFTCRGKIIGLYLDLCDEYESKILYTPFSINPATDCMKMKTAVRITHSDGGLQRSNS